MIKKTVIRCDRVRRLAGSFGYIEHRFLRDGFFQSLTHEEITLYLFLTLAADRHGLSYYSYDKICKLLNLDLDDYILARDGLIKKDLIAFDGTLFQVLSLPQKTVLAR
ncbi:MAG: helix-turn-helix domain-containing protein [Sulfurimonas sp.]|nr:helix-turn-helix domain-containing protein [Sulfurimonas sp.]